MYASWLLANCRMPSNVWMRVVEKTNETANIFGSHSNCLQLIMIFQCRTGRLKNVKQNEKLQTRKIDEIPSEIENHLHSSQIVRVSMLVWVSLKFHSFSGAAESRIDFSSSQNLNLLSLSGPSLCQKLSKFKLQMGCGTLRWAAIEEAHCPINSNNDSNHYY